MAKVPDYHRKSFDRLDELTETEPIIGDMKAIKPSLGTASQITQHER